MGAEPTVITGTLNRFFSGDTSGDTMQIFHNSLLFCTSATNGVLATTKFADFREGFRNGEAGQRVGAKTPTEK